MSNSFCKGLRKVISLLEQGSEFHPSLNPPSFIGEELDNTFSIDYDKLAKVIERERSPDKIEKVKQITSQP